MRLRHDQTLALLKELNDWLAFEGCEPVEWVVCGGTALLLQGLVIRTTRDVDVLGCWNPISMQVVPLAEFPEQVCRCIAKVAENHPGLAGMKDHWVNLGPSQIARWGLPPGYEQRLRTIEVGSHLTLKLLSRDDLIPLKLYAAADDLGQRQRVHLDDLKALEPTFDELDTALSWVLALPDIEPRKPQLQAIVEELGHGELGTYI